MPFLPMLKFDAERVGSGGVFAVIDSSDSMSQIPETLGTDLEQVDRIESLDNELVERDESIANLREEVSKQEETLAVQRSELENLHAWVEQVELRIDVAGCYDEIFNSVPFPRIHQDAPLFAPKPFGHKSEWEAERDSVTRELESLKEELRRSTTNPPGSSDRGDPKLEHEPLIETLQNERAEFQRLLESHDKLARDYETLEQSHQQTTNELRAAMVEAEQRERASADLEVNREIHKKVTNPLESDERIRAFRVHLDGIHAEESAARASKGGFLRLRWFKPERKRS